ncbi:MAG: universal stress protein [Myxococcales bacterium]|nr:universal stress protein [Myxococcales bacterium]
MTQPAPNKKILVPIDFSSEQPRVLQQARVLAEQLNASVWLLHCAAPLELSTVAFEPVYVPAEVIERFRGDHLAAAGLKLEEVAEELRANLAVETHVKACAPAEGIVKLATEARCDYVVMGSRGGGLGPFLLGSVAEQVARHSPCPVVVAREDADVAEYKKVLVGVDFSPASPPLVQLACELTSADGEIHLVHGWQPPHLDSAHLFGDTGHESLVSALGAGLQQHVGYLEAFATELPDDKRFRLRVEEGRPATTLVELSESLPADAVFVGSHESQGLRGLLGTVADRVLRRAKTTVLLTEAARDAALLAG